MTFDATTPDDVAASLQAFTAPCGSPLATALTLALPPRVVDASVLEPPLLTEVAYARLGAEMSEARSDLADALRFFVQHGLLTERQVIRAISAKKSERAVHRLLEKTFKEWVNRLHDEACELTGIARRDKERILFMSIASGRGSYGYRANDESSVSLGVSYNGDCAIYNLAKLRALPETAARGCWLALQAIYAFIAPAMLPHEAAEYAGWWEATGEYEVLQKAKVADDPVKALAFIQARENDFMFFAGVDDADYLASRLEMVKALAEGLSEWKELPPLPKSPRLAAKSLRRWLRMNRVALESYPLIHDFVERVAHVLHSRVMDVTFRKQQPHEPYDDDDTVPLAYGTFLDLGYGFEGEVVQGYMDGMMQQGTCCVVIYDLKKCDAAGIGMETVIQAAGQMLYADLARLLG